MKYLIIVLMALISCQDKKVDRSAKVVINEITKKHIGYGYYDVILHFEINCRERAFVNSGRGARYTGSSIFNIGDTIIVNYLSKGCCNFDYVRKIK